MWAASSGEALHLIEQRLERHRGLGGDRAQRVVSSRD